MPTPKLTDYTPEELEALHRNFLNDIRSSPNNLSFWFPKVRDCGIRVPETHVIPIPENVHDAFYMENGDSDRKRIAAFVHEMVIPVVSALPGLPFIKNGCFSGKFDFNRCCPPDKDEKTIVESITDIQYESLCFDTGGSLEIVIRERIPSPKDMPRIYGGMPLNTEFRLFYDFDLNEPLYLVNYWDRGYCRDTIAERSPSDGEAFDRRWPSLHAEYLRSASSVFVDASRALKGVKGLAGQWSVDFLLGADGTLWLIDMAIARQSAYWDPYKAKLASIGDRIEDFVTAQGLPSLEGEFVGYFVIGKDEMGKTITDRFLEAWHRANPYKEDFVTEEKFPEDEQTKQALTILEDYRQKILSVSDDEAQKLWQRKYDRLAGYVLILTIENYLLTNNHHDTH